MIDNFYSQVLSPETDRVTIRPGTLKERKSLIEDTVRPHVVSFRKQELNKFLTSCGVSQIRTVDIGLPTTTERTRRRNMSEACDAMVAVLQTLSPRHPGELWEELRKSDKLCEVLNVTKITKMASPQNDMKYLNALAEAFSKATSKNVRKQIISIMADISTYEEMRLFIPDLTKYMFCEARKHSLLYGRGALVASKSGPRCKIDLQRLDHFLSFITSPYIVQDLPFGEKFLKLSSGEVVQTPNVIRVSVSERIINQYLQYCKESETDPLSKSTLRRILAACKASTRTSLQGLDYFVSEGSKAFDDLHELLDKLSNCGLEISMVQNLQRKLQAGRNYLKTNFKLSVSYAL